MSSRAFERIRRLATTEGKNRPLCGPHIGALRLEQCAAGQLGAGSDNKGDPWFGGRLTVASKTSEARRAATVADHEGAGRSAVVAR